MCRSILQLFFGFLIVVLLIPTTLVTVFTARALDQGFYQNGLEQSGIYQSLPELLADELEFTISGFDFDEETGLEEIDPQQAQDLAASVLDSIVPVVADPVFVQDLVDSNLDNLFGYINSETDQILVYLPKEQLLQKLNEAVDVLFTEILDQGIGEFADLDICTEAELEELINNPPESFDQIPCIPDFASEEVAIEDLSELNAGIDMALQEVLDGPDNMELSVFAEQFDVEGYEEIEQTLSDARRGVSYVKLGLLLLWISILIVVGMFVLLSRGDIWRRIQSLAVPTGFAGALLGVIGIGTVASVEFIQMRVFDRSLDDFPPALARSASELLEYFVGSLLIPIAIIGVVMFVVSVLLVVGLHFMPSTKQPSLEA